MYRGAVCFDLFSRDGLFISICVRCRVAKFIGRKGEWRSITLCEYDLN